MRLKKKFKIIFSILIILAILICCYFLFIDNDTNENSIIKKVIKKDSLTQNDFLNTSYLYLPLGSSIEIEGTSLESTNNNLLIEGNKITTTSIGKSTLKVIRDNIYDELEIEVTDIITNYETDNKEFLKCDQYSEDEANLLDKILESQISFYGLNTRAGALQAARFLSLEFKQKLKYFYENGRMADNDTFDFCDGEGRFYHKGLYLSDTKFSLLKGSRQGPKHWGCDMYEETRKTIIPNGLDCSGFMTWSLVNAGFDPGDLGAGFNNKQDLTDLGERIEFTDETVWNKIRVGDFVGRKGHIAMLIGIKDGIYYIAEELDYDMHILKYTKEDLMNSELKYFVLMDNFYKEDGYLTDYWE